MSASLKSALGLALPLAALTWPALTPGRIGCGGVPAKPPRRATSSAEVVRRIPTEPGVLINIHRGLFPASGDLTRLGQKATPALRRALLENTDASVRWRAALVLTQLRDVSARPDLHAALKDWIPAVRGQALRALGAVGDPTSVPLILTRLEDPDETVANRVAAIRALGRIGHGRAAQAIVHQFHEALPVIPRLVAKPGQPAIRRAAVDALWDLRHAMPRGALLPMLHLALVDRDDRVVKRAAIVLGNLRDHTALIYLRRVLLNRSLELRNVAAWAMGKIGHPRGVAHLMEALPRVRSGRLLNNISFALKRLQARDLWPHLRGLLTHTQAYIRLNAAYTAGEMRLPRSRALLETLLADPNEMVRAEAVVALAKLRAPTAHWALRKHAEHARGPQLELTLRAALYVQPDADLRNRYLKLTARGKRRRRAGLVLAALGDPRAAPMLFPLLRQGRDPAVWGAVQELENPLMEDLLAQQTTEAIGRTEVPRLPPLLRSLPRDRLAALAKPLLRLLFRAWPQLGDRRVTHEDALLTVIAALGHTGQAPVRTWLQPYLQHRGFWIRMETRLALARLGDEAIVGELAQALVTASDPHRTRLAQLLGELPLPLARKALQPLLPHPDPYVALAAAVALYRAGAPRNAALLTALRSPHTSLRIRARGHLSRGLDRAGHARLETLRSLARSPVARAELDRLLTAHRPRKRGFGEFVPREVALY